MKHYAWNQFFKTTELWKRGGGLQAVAANSVINTAVNELN